MDKTLHLAIHTILGTICDEEVTYVEVPLTDGRMGILHNHAPVLGAVRAGTVRYRTPEGEHTVHVGDGILQVAENKVSILISGEED